MKCRAFSALLLAGAATSFAAETGDWPAHRGPFANGTGVDCGKEMIEDLAQARVVWLSEEKTPSAYPCSFGSANAFIQGGYAAPVVTGGKVYLFYWEPSGTACDQQYVKKGLAEPRTRHLGEAVMRKKYAFLADDVILCADAATGKTLWKSVHAGKGISFSKQGRGIHISVKGSPRLDVCVSGGRVFSIGTTGRIYALDAATGRLQWESKLEKTYAAIEPVVNERLKGKEDTRFPRVSNTVCPVVVDGVLVVDDDGGLTGLDPASGKVLWGPVTDWRTAGGSCPLRWVYKGRELVMAQTTCVDPKTGKVMWKADGAVHIDESGCVALTEDYLVCCGGARKGGTGLQVYKITPEGATKAWALGPEFAVQQFASPVIYKGHVYTRVAGSGGKNSMVCVELATGKVVGKAEVAAGSCNEIVGFDGRVFYEGSYQGPSMYKADAADFKPLGAGALKDLDFACSVPPAIANGRMYYRSNRYGIMCLDLTKGSKEGRSAAEVVAQFSTAAKKEPAPSAAE